MISFAIRLHLFIISDYLISCYRINELTKNISTFSVSFLNLGRQIDLGDDLKYLSQPSQFSLKNTRRQGSEKNPCYTKISFNLTSKTLFMFFPAPVTIKFSGISSQFSWVVFLRKFKIGNTKPFPVWFARCDFAQSLKMITQVK